MACVQKKILIRENPLLKREGTPTQIIQQGVDALGTGRPNMYHGGEGSSTWRRSPVDIKDWPPAQIDFRPYRGSIDAFIDDRISEPRLDKLTLVTDHDGESWVLLDASFDQLDPDSPKRSRGLQQVCSLHSWLVPKEEAATLLPHLAELRRKRFRDLVVTEGHIDCCYFGEIGWTPHSCCYRHADFFRIELAGEAWRLVSTVESYTWEGNILDCSIGESAMADLPSTFIQACSKLEFDEHGPCWLDPSATVVFTNFGARVGWRNRALIVRSSWLQAFLLEHDLELMVASWFERRFLDADRTRTYRYENVYSAARFDAQMKLHLADPIRVEE